MREGVCLVETASGTLRLVRAEELACRPCPLPEALPLLLAVVLAASLATLAVLGAG